MSHVGSAAGGAPGPSPRTAVQNVQRVQQRIIVLNTQYGHVLGQFNMALQRLQTHVGTSRPQSAGAVWDTKATQLAAAVDRLSLQVESLTDRLDDLVDELSEAREVLGAMFAAPNAAAGAGDGPTLSAPVHDAARA